MKYLLMFAATLILVSRPVAAQDIREAERKAAEDRETVLKHAREVEDRILSDRQQLTTEVEKLERQKQDLETDISQLSHRIETLSQERVQLQDRWAGKELQFKEISGNIHVAARDLDALVRDALTSIHGNARFQILDRILREGYFPDIEDISGMAALCFDEIRRSGEVALLGEADFIGRDGRIHTGEILRLGNFTLVYRTPTELGFLEYVPGQERPIALSALPSRKIRGQFASYMGGKSDSVPIDFSGGLALRQLKQQSTLLEQIRSGGPIVYPILLIALVALVIVAERVVYLHRVHKNTDRMMEGIEGLAGSGDWERAQDLTADTAWKRSPVVRVLTSGLAARSEDRETLENVLQEAILREVPRLERFLPVLAVMGTIAPLLGLLGTVTGMITTFQVITLHGTGDPRLMSGGISEALITTELGLAVAIPIMLLHAVLSRRVNRLVGEMEEKAIALTNLIHRERVS